jgi:ATP-dependent 26S proteasome regulatory subunit
MTTNNIDRLDPIMIRDGRIDIKIKFEKMSRDNTIKYLEYVFDEKVSDINSIPDRKYTPAEIQSIVEKALINDMTIDDCIIKLINKLIT